MDIFKQFVTDPDKEKKGVWCPLSGDAEFLIARMGNREYTRELTQEVERYSAALDGNDDVSDDTSDNIMVKLLSKHILLAWRGTVEYKGEALPYSKEAAEKLLSVKDFRKWVIRQSELLKNFRAAEDKVIEKNS